MAERYECDCGTVTVVLSTEVGRKFVRPHDKPLPKELTEDYQAMCEHSFRRML